MRTYPILISVFTIIFLLTSTTAFTETSIYTVEIIVFKYKNNPYFKNENWNSDWQYPDLHTSIDFQQGAPQQNPAFITKLGKLRQRNLKEFKLLSVSGKTLGKEAEALGNSSQYHLLAHYVWQQPGLAMDEAISIRIKGGNHYTLPVWQKNLTPATLDNTSVNPIADNNPTYGNYELDGNITLVMSRFLHIYTDLLFLQPVKHITDQYSASLPEKSHGETPDLQQTSFNPEITHEADPDAKLLGIPINHHRRMRSGELHHLDHPMVGILIKITRA